MTIITIKDCIDHSGYTKGTIPKGVWVKLLSIYTNFYGRYIDVQYCGKRYSIRDGEFVVEWDRNDFDGVHVCAKCRCGTVAKTCLTAVRTIPYDYNLTQYWDILHKMKEISDKTFADPIQMPCPNDRCFVDALVTVYRTTSYGHLPSGILACNSAITDDMWKEYRNDLETTLRGIGYYD